MRTYAIADLHGRMDLLRLAYDAIVAHNAFEPAKIVHLGDYVDRGPESRQIIEFLMDPTTVPKNYTRIVLKGNHEDIMWQSCRKLPYIGWWLQNGGGPTLISYGQKPGDLADKTVVPDAHLDWIESLPLYHEDELRVFVHAGLRDGVPLEKQTEHDLIWKLYKDTDQGGWCGKYVVHGHHQFADGPKIYDSRVDLDTGAFYSNRLVVGVFDNETRHPIDFLEVTTPDLGVGTVDAA